MIYVSVYSCIGRLCTAWLLLYQVLLVFILLITVQQSAYEMSVKSNKQI